MEATYKTDEKTDLSQNLRENEKSNMVQRDGKLC